MEIFGELVKVLVISGVLIAGIFFSHIFITLRKERKGKKK